MNYYQTKYKGHSQVQKFQQTDLLEIDGKERFSEKKIMDMINNWSDVGEYTKINQSYYKGENPYILSGQRSDGSYKDPKVYGVTTAEGYKLPDGAKCNGTSGGEPDWRIPVAYAAKIVDTVAGYMYKPGSIQFQVEDNDNYQKSIDQVNKKNDGEIKNSEVGIDQSINGIAFELIRTDGTEKATPKYSRIPLENGVPVYDFELERNLIGFIYFYNRVIGGQSATKVNVYYAWGFDEYTMIDGVLELKDSTPYFFDEVPVAVYQNNKENIGDFDRVKSLIDAYDYLISDNANESERFAQAYLVLLGMNIDPEKIWDIKEKRVIQGDLDGAASFLTKELNADYFLASIKTLREEIHKQSHIVDFTDEKFGGNLSGSALDRLLLDMNNLSNIKEIYFKKGLGERLRLMGKLILTPTSEIPEVEITMIRNVPQDLDAQAEFLVKTNGQISQETRFQNTPVVKNVKEEIAKVKKEIGTNQIEKTIDETIEEED